MYNFHESAIAMMYQNFAYGLALFQDRLFLAFHGRFVILSESSNSQENEITSFADGLSLKCGFSSHPRRLFSIFYFYPRVPIEKGKK